MFFVLLFLILLLIIICNSKIEVKIDNLDISTDRVEKIKKKFDIYLGIIIFNKIEVLKINIKKIKSKKINLGTVLEKANKFEEKTDRHTLLGKIVKSLKSLKFEIKRVDLKLEVGTEDAALTALLVGTVATILGIILKKQKFEILPIYQDKNILNIKLDCIFRINLIHYIYITILKGRDKNERKSSYRRAYAYSDE